MQGLKAIREAKANEAREEAKRYSISSVAAEMGVSKPTIISWEKGETSPSLEQAAKLAKLYGCSVDIFLPSE